MDLDSRKSEARGELKRLDIQVEVSISDLNIVSQPFTGYSVYVQEVLSRALITISELKTQVEESRWEKLKAAVGESITYFPSGVPWSHSLSRCIGRTLRGHHYLDRGLRC